MNILDVISKAEALKKETEINSVTPDRVGSIMVDTLKILNEYQAQSGALAIQKIYTSEAAMLQDAQPVSDLTGRSLKIGQLVVIVPSDPFDATAGKIYLFAGTNGHESTWNFVTKIGDFNDLYAKVLSNEAAIADAATKITGLQNGKANTDGKYPQLTSGFASNLVGRGEAVDATIGFRASGGTSIEDGAARVKELQGNAVVWNQKASFRVLVDSLGIAQISDIEGGKMITLTQDYTGSADYEIRMAYNGQLIAGHVYCVSMETYSSKGGRVNMDYSGSITNRGDIPSNTWSLVSAISVAASDKATFNIYPNFKSVGYLAGDTFGVRNVRVTDLTQMFRADNEPTTIEEFYARMPIGVNVNAYNEGEVISMNAEGIKSVGFNAWDGVAYDGYVDDSNGVLQPSSVRKITGYIRVLPNEDYYIKSTPSAQWGAWYDANKNYIGGIVGYNRVVTSPSNAAYVALTIRNKVEDTIDLCINLSHTGYRNGEYQPYMEFVRNLDTRIKEAFPNGMMLWDKVYNKNGKGYIVKGTGSVDLGTLGWYLSDVRKAASLNGASLNVSNASPANIICSVYATKSYNDVYGQQIGISVTVSGTNAIVAVYDSSYTDAASFKAAMAGTMLYYELAEPTIIEYDEPFNLDYEVWDFGTEQMIASQPSAPIKAKIAYGFNAVDSVRTAQIEIAELKTQIAQMQAAMASMTIPASIEEI